jgi:RNA polymerase primary sigma factor
MDPNLTRYFADIRDRPPLSREDEAILARCIRRRRSGKTPNDLVECNLGFVVTIAAEYRGLGLPFEDLINEGNLGLIEAAHRYDPSRGVRFITYAVWWIRKAILKAIADHSSVVRVPTYRRKKMRQVRDAEQSLRGTLGRTPDRAEIADHLAGAVAHLDSLLHTTPREISLDDPCAPDAERVVRDVIADAAAICPEDRVLRDEDKTLVRRALEALTEKERRVIRERYGLAGFRPMTLNEIGQRMGISRERVRQIEVQAKEKIRRSVDRWKRVESPPKEAKSQKRQVLRRV